MFRFGVRGIVENLSTPSFLARPLLAADTLLDYQAYMASPDVIQVHSGGRWPIEGYTVEENRRLAAQHEQDHKQGKNFTFTLMNSTETECLGCLYFLPLLPFLQRVKAPEHLHTNLDLQTAMITFWVHQAYQETTLSDGLVTAVSGWLSTRWAFSGYYFRVNQDESRSLVALQQTGLQEHFTLDLPISPYRYYFYGR